MTANIWANGDSKIDYVSQWAFGRFSHPWIPETDSISALLKPPGQNPQSMLYIGDPGLMPFPGTGVVGKPSVTSPLILPLVPDTGRKENLDTMVSPLLPPNPWSYPGQLYKQHQKKIFFLILNAFFSSLFFKQSNLEFRDWEAVLKVWI